MHLVLDVPFLAHPFKTPKGIMDSKGTPDFRGTRMVAPSVLAELLHSDNLESTLLIDSRSFLEYNTSHVLNSVNVGCSKIVKRRLEQNKLSIQELLSTSCKGEKPDSSCDVIVYDQSTQDVSRLCPDSFIVVLLGKLAEAFKTVSMLSGGFTAFKTDFPYLCESQGQAQCTMMGTTLSQPCLPVAKVGPTRVLNYLYIGSQQDVLDEDIMRANGINYVLNVSKTCPSPRHIAPGHFHRIPVRDNYGEKLLPWFEDAMDFIEKVRSANGCVIVHCLAGISRSPTVAIAYIMKHMNLTVDEAYKYVKEKRQSISPNFNFLGQLLEFEKRLQKDQHPVAVSANPSLATTATATTATATTSTTTSTTNSNQSTSSDSKSSSPKPPAVEASSRFCLPNPTFRVTKPEAPFPEPILLTEEIRPATVEPTTPSVSEPRTCKRTIGQKEGWCPEARAAQSPKLRTRTIPRPCGLDVKVSKIGPIFLGSPPSSEPKKPRSGHNSPCGLVEQLEWGTSHLSVNSPEVRQKNPFVEACARLAEKRLQEEAESHAQDEAKQLNCKVESKDAVAEKMVIAIEPLNDAHASAAEAQETKVHENVSSISGLGQDFSGTETAPVLPRKEEQRKSADKKRRGILKTDGKSKAKGRSRSPRTVSPRPAQMPLKQTLAAKLQVNAKSNKEPAQVKAKKTSLPSEMSVSFQFGRTTVEKLIDSILPNTGVKCKTGKSETKDLPQLSVSKEVHLQLESPRILGQSALNRSTSPKDPLNLFFTRQVSSQSQSSDNSSGISPSCSSESGSVSLGSPCSSGISPDYTGQSASLFDTLGNLVKSYPTFSTGTEGEAALMRVRQNSNSVSVEERQSNIWQKRKECGNSFEETRRPDSEKTSGFTSKRDVTISDHVDFERNDPRCSRKTTMVVAGRSSSCEEIGSCAREAVSEIVRPRREIIDLSNYSGMEGEEDDYDSRSLSSQRSLSSSCEMIEVS